MPGTQPRAGRVRALPVGGAIVYVQPHYATRGDGVSVVTRVAVLAPGAPPRFGRTLMGAVGAIAPTPNGPDGARTPDFRARVTALYDAMQGALRRGDLTAFGAAYRDLGALLGRR
jgi:hypothetical protein